MRIQKFLSIVTIALLMSCSSNFEEETNDIEMREIELNEKRSKKLPELEAHFTFDSGTDLGLDLLGKNNLSNNGVQPKETNNGDGVAYFDGQSYFKAAETGVKKGFFHHKIKKRSYMFWIKPTGIQNEQIIIDEGGGVNSVAVRIVDSKIEAAIMTRGVKNREIITTEFNNTSDWSHVAVTFKKGYFRLYLNGNLISEVCTNFKKVRRHPNGGAIGSQYGRNAFTGRTEPQAIKNFFTGYMEDLKIYNIALTEEQIMDEYVNNKPGEIGGPGGPR